VLLTIQSISIQPLEHPLNFGSIFSCVFYVDVHLYQASMLCWSTWRWMHLSPAPFALLQNQSVDQQRKQGMFSTTIEDSPTNQTNMIISSTTLTAVSSYRRTSFPPCPSMLTTPTSTTCIPKNFMGTSYNLTLISPTCYPRMLLLSLPSLRNIGVYLTIMVLSRPFAIISASLILALPHQLP
jgi:hypothetical protein